MLATPESDDRLPPHLQEYEKECAQFLQGMSPAEIEQAKQMGLLKEVYRNGRRTGTYVLADNGLEKATDVCRDDDAAVLFENSAILSTPELITVSADKLPNLLAEKFDLTEGQAEGIVAWHQERLKAEIAQETSSILRRVIGFFLLADNAKICAHALAHAARMARLTGFSSLRRSADAIGVSVEGIRKVAWKWVELLGLPPLEGAKSPEAKARYSADKKTNHWRNRPCTLENLAPGATPSPTKKPTTGSASH
jgi:hypothetical protein